MRYGQTLMVKIYVNTPGKPIYLQFVYIYKRGRSPSPPSTSLLSLRDSANHQLRRIILSSFFFFIFLFYRGPSTVSVDICRCGRGRRRKN